MTKYYRCAKYQLKLLAIGLPLGFLIHAAIAWYIDKPIMWNELILTFAIFVIGMIAQGCYYKIGE